MTGRVNYKVCLILPLIASAFLISVPIAFADPNLISWWKFDEGSGNTVYDSAGSNSGTINGATWFNDPCRGMCLGFDGIGDRVIVADKDNLEQQEFTLSFWARLNIPSGPRQGGIAKGNIFGTAAAYSYKIDFDSGYAWPAVTNTSDTAFSTSGPIGDDGWHLWSMTVGSGTLALYKDGAFVNSIGFAGTIDYEKSYNDFVIGAKTNGSYAFYGEIDDVRFYDRALTSEEIQQFYAEVFGGRAYGPSPYDGATAVADDKILGWSPGKDAASHHVYLGTSYNNVNNADTSSPEYKGNFDVNTFNPHWLKLGETYYWRIDEVSNPDVWKGDVWSFTVDKYPTFRSFSGACRHTRDPLPPLYDNALGWGRQDIPWSELEPTRNNWDQVVLDSFGNLVLAYNAKDGHLLPILDYGTDWAGGYRFIDTAHIPDWQNYVARVVDFLRKPPYNVEYFQIWNEPDIDMFWSGDIDTFMTNVHLPASEVIHNLGCKVVFGGWSWVGVPSNIVDLLDRHNAWDSIDVLDTHYRNIGDLQYLRDEAAARGYYNMPVWETEVGYMTDLHFISDFYPRMFYWALTHNADADPDMYKIFYYREESSDTPGTEGYHKTLYSGSNPWHLGESLQTLADLFDDGIVSDYQGVANNRSLTPQQSLYSSSIESFKLDDRVVTAIHLMYYDLANPNTDTIVLTYPDLRQAGDVNSIKRVDVAGYETDLNASYGVNGLTVTVPVANDPCSPVQSWGLDGSIYNFYVVINEFNPFEINFTVTNKRRVGRTLFEYDCVVTLTNISSYPMRNVQLGIVRTPENMYLIDPTVTFGDIEIRPGQSVTSSDTCTFQVDRSQSTDPVEIIWNSTFEIVGGSPGAQNTVSGACILQLENVPGDITGNGKVDFDDLKILTDQWLQPPGTPSADIAPPPDGDNIVNFLDFALLADNWLQDSGE